MSALLLLGAISTAASLAGMEEGRMIYTVYPTAKPPTIDGRLDDPGWSEVPLVLFSQHRPALQPTTVRLMYDDEAVYVGFECLGQDPKPALSRAGLVGMWVSDHVELFLQPQTDTSGYVQLGLKINGDRVLMRFPRVERNQASSEDKWSEHWQTKVAIVDNGWSAEIRVPYEGLPGASAPGPGSTWLANFTRMDFASGEMSTWGRGMWWNHIRSAWGRLYFASPKWPVVALADKGQATFGTNTARFSIQGPVEPNVVVFQSQTEVVDGEITYLVQRSAPATEGESHVDYQISQPGRVMVTLTAALGNNGEQPLYRYVFPVEAPDLSQSVRNMELAAQWDGQ